MLKNIVIFILMLYCFAFGFEYQITGPKNVSSLENVKYRVIVFNNKKNELVPVRVLYKGRILMEKKVKDNAIFNLNLSSLDLKENSQVDIDFCINNEINTVSLQYVPDFKAIIFTDKPLYQPGQTVYIKGIVFKNGKPINSKVEILINDPKSNKIFYKSFVPKNGLFFEKFVISDLVVNGIYTVIIRSNGKDLAVNRFEVKKYTLPKFKIDLSYVDNPDIFEVGKRYRVKIDCSYFFGRKVANSSVVVNIFSFDVGFEKIYSVEGRTDNNGVFYFDLKIPSYLVGIDKNKAILRIDVEVEDSAGQVEQKTQTIEVFSTPIVAHLIPSNNPVKDMENKFYLIVSYANSKEGNFKVNFLKPFKKEFSTNGFLEFTYRPTLDYEEFVFDVSDDKGNKNRFTQSVYSAMDKSVLIFRDRSIYQVGENMRFKLYSNMSTHVYLDFFVKSENSYRTVYTDSVYLEAFKVREYQTSVNPDFRGELVVRAYFIRPDGTIGENFKSFIVQDPQELKIYVKKNKDIYKVRDSLILDIYTDEKSDIFVDIVDEALLYLAKSDPELLKLYLQLEKELLEPKYEIHSIKDVLIYRKEGILNAILDKKNLKENLSYGHYNFPEQDYQGDLNVYFINFNSVRKKIEMTIKKMEVLYTKCYNYYYANKKFPKDFKELGLKKKDYVDEWGTTLRLLKKNNYLEIISAGLDGKFGTEDDINYPNYAMRDTFFQTREFGINVLKKVEVASVPKANVESDKSGFVVREYFPETFYSSLISVDKSQKLSLKLPDSITNWKAQFFGVSKSGKIGSKTVDITVFQEFFIDIDNPLFLTNGDEVSIPIVVYNYTSKKMDVNVELQQDRWFELLDKNNKKISVEPQSNTSVYFKIRAKKIGMNNLTVFAHNGKFRDAIKKQIEVIPNGFAVFNNKTAYVNNAYSNTFVIPYESVDDSSKVYLYVYPNFSSQLLSGLDKLLGMPYGCFEQTSAVNYPNILIMKYMRNRGLSNPAIEMKSEYYLNIGYQRLITFEVEGGGFSWFGDKPANKVLSAFGLMEFKDMKSVFFVDDNIIERTKKFLISQQNSDGSWDPDKEYLHSESWGGIQKQKINVTSYILMALLDNDDKVYQQYNKELKKSVNFVYNYLRNDIKNIDNYTLGLMLNIFADLQNKEKMASVAIDLIITELEIRAIKSDDTIYWKGMPKTLFYGEGVSSDIETTSVIGLGLIKLKRFDLAIKAVKYLINSKDERGMWYSTQPTILALKAITYFDLSSSLVGKPNQVKIFVNDKSINLNFSKDEVAYKIIDITSFVVKGENRLKIESQNPILLDLNYNFYMPFSMYKPIKNLIDIDISYDKTELQLADKVKVSVELNNLSNKILEMVVVDLGIPPGFTVDISMLYSNPKVKNVETTNRQIIIYFDKINPNESVFLHYQLISKYPLRVKIPFSRVYEYYTPSNFIMKEGNVIDVK
ncbi:MAG: alpha-2-macroglobulin family protein [Candidatus Calescibacterium sp.]|nr:MG2 domain-containing protein [Candidatus Calescibacterium sp.]MDW8132533.1 alpha-2-macroglobulin family protein [Candidatus Calescibacterium sp.]